MTAKELIKEILEQAYTLDDEIIIIDGHYGKEFYAEEVRAYTERDAEGYPIHQIHIL